MFKSGPGPGSACIFWRFWRMFRIMVLLYKDSLFSFSLLAGCVMFAFRIAWYLLEFILPSSKVSCASGCQTASKYNTSTSMFNSGQGVFSSNATLFFFQTFVGDCSQRVFNFLFQQSTVPVSKIPLAYLDSNLAYFSDWHLCWGYRWRLQVLLLTRPCRSCLCKKCAPLLLCQLTFLQVHRVTCGLCFGFLSSKFQTVGWEDCNIICSSTMLWKHQLA